jgi:hypothetical protein
LSPTTPERPKDLSHRDDKEHLMKIYLSLILGVILGQGSQAQLLVEHFSYNNGSLGGAGVGSGVWSGGDSPSSAITVNSTAALTNSSLAGREGSGVIFTGGTFKKKAAPFTAQTSGTLYCSFLLNAQTAPSTVKAFVYFRNGNSATSSPELGIFLNGNVIGLGKSVSSPSVNTTLSTGTHLIVARYSFLAGNDQVDLWVDPSSLGDNGNVPSATLTTGTGSSSDASTLSYIFLNHAASQTLWIDEVRVGTSWSDVTPTGGTPPAPPSVSSIMQSFLAPEGFVLRGSGGTTNGTYYVVTSTDITATLSNWFCIATNQFDASGNFDCTNSVSPSDARRFYRVWYGSPGPVNPVAPSINTQPQSQTVLQGQTANFSVVATGTAPLSYQWYFNSSTPVGNGTATLTLNNAQPGDVGGYSVVIASSAGSVTSVVATLSVNTPVAPSINTQPQNQTVTEGQGASFSVTAAGTPPLSYQWYFNTNSPLANATNSTLGLSGVSTNDAGGYSVVVANNYGSITSAIASLTVNPAPTNGGPVQILQAEEGSFTGTVDNNHSGYTGNGFVNTVNATGSYIEWEFGRQHAGTETFYVRYAQDSGNRTASVMVNGTTVTSSMDFPATGSFTSWQYVTNTIPVTVGRNVIRITALTSSGLANIDHIEITGDPQYKMSLAVSGNGTVSLNPSNTFAFYDPSTSVTLTATPLTGSVFTAWSGDLVSSNNPETLVVNANKSVTAGFEAFLHFPMYVSPTGNDANLGTIDQPFYSLAKAVSNAVAGDTIYMRGGTFTYSATVTIAKPGTSNSPISILAYPGEQPILDYSTWVPANETIRGGARGLHITTNAQYWVLKGLEIQYAPDNGVKSEGGHITFDTCVFHHNGDGGLQIGLNKDTLSSNPDPEHAAAYNYVLNCDAYRNADPATSYENADGFSCKLYAGKGNYYYGCRAWENADDGWDCYQTEYPIVIENCWTWHNGDPSLWGFSSFNGDGNGFKLGGDNTYCPITLRNCVALNCLWGTTVGYAYNNNTAPITLYNCAALNCGRPYNLQQSGNVLKNCLDLNSTRPAPVDIDSSATMQNDSWNLPVTVSAADFANLTEADAIAPRQADGSLPNNGFARLVAGSDLIDKGVDVGLPYCGSAPDLGAYEYCP